MVTGIKMNKVTKKYSKEFLDSHGIWITYIISPITFNPFIKFFSKHDLEWTEGKEFDKSIDIEKVDNYIDSVVEKIIYKNRSKKIKKIISR
jgi:hypothetical protein